MAAREGPGGTFRAKERHTIERYTHEPAGMAACTNIIAGPFRGGLFHGRTLGYKYKRMLASVVTRYSRARDEIERRSRNAHDALYSL